MLEVLPEEELDFKEGLAQRTREESYVQMSVDQNLLLMSGFTIAALEENMALDLPLSQNPCVSYQHLLQISRVRALIFDDLLHSLSQYNLQSFSEQDILDANPAWKDAYRQLGIILAHFIYMHKKHLGEMTMSPR